MYDFSFLAPCPSSGIIIQGEADEVVTPSAVQKLVDKLRTQRTSRSTTISSRAPTTSSRASSTS
jgi:alpha/beta superfamily hydrolase